MRPLLLVALLAMSAYSSSIAPTRKCALSSSPTLNVVAQGDTVSYVSALEPMLQRLADTTQNSATTVQR